MEAAAETEPAKKAGWHLPEWAREWARKLLPLAVWGVILAGLGLYHDNIGNKKDISRNTWRNDQQDMRLERLENRQDRADASINDLLDEQGRFHPEVLRRLQELLEIEKRRNKQR